MRTITIMIIVAVSMSTAFGAFGDIDTTFGTNGSFTFLTVPSGTNSFGQTVALLRQSDGKIVVVGQKVENNNGSGAPYYYITIKRYTAAGVLDTSYGNNGYAIPNNSYGSPTSASFQSDGKLIVGGNAGTGSAVNKPNYIWRFKTDGWYDASFGTNGRVYIGDSSSGIKKVEAIRLTSGATTQHVVAYFGSSIKRLSSTGVISNAFGNSGSLIGVGETFVTQNAGTFQNASIVTAHFYSESIIILHGFNGDGQSDPSFGTNGMTMAYLGTFDSPVVRNLIRTPQGKLVMYGSRCIAGCINYSSFVTSHSSTGFLENSNTTFGTGYGIIYSVASNPDGTLILPYGSVDPIKKLTNNLSPIDEAPGEYCNDILIQPDTKFVCASGNKVTRYLQ